MIYLAEFRNAISMLLGEGRAMKIGFFCAVGVAVVSLVLSGSASAHHGDANRYDEKVIVLKGTLVEVQMVNPHSLIAFDVTDEGGKTVRWQAELSSAQQLVKTFGWSKTTVKAGDKITVTGRRVKSGAPYMNLTERANVVLTDSGKEIFRTENYGQPAPQ
jgi:hypothetical protein